MIALHNYQRQSKPQKVFLVVRRPFKMKPLAKPIMLRQNYQPLKLLKKLDLLVRREHRRTMPLLAKTSINYQQLNKAKKCHLVVRKLLMKRACQSMLWQLQCQLNYQHLCQRRMLRQILKRTLRRLRGSTTVSIRSNDRTAWWNLEPM